MENKLWHDLIENPNDLPEKNIYLRNGSSCIDTVVVFDDKYITSAYYWHEEKAFIYPDIIKWCYVDELINIDKNGK